MRNARNLKLRIALVVAVVAVVVCAMTLLRPANASGPVFKGLEGQAEKTCEAATQ